MSRKRRANGTIDKLKPALKDTVDQMLLSGQTYREICQYLAENDVKLTQASVSRYARRFLKTPSRRSRRKARGKRSYGRIDR